MWKKKLSLPSFLIVITGDLISKGLTHNYLPLSRGISRFPFGGVPIFKNCMGIDLCLHHVTNRGAAWGFGETWQIPLLLLRIGILVAIFLYVKHSSNATRYRYSWALLLGGGVGNILDYFIYGHVVDMFHFILWGYSYPVFNIADIAIFCGILHLVYLSFIQSITSRYRASQDHTSS